MKWIMLLVCLNWLHGEDARVTYIDTYKDIAIVEMHRKGVPASIKLAQGILESGNGVSTFAQATNNHIGIKCKSGWKGLKYDHYDDDYDSSGKLIHSCFRSYDSVLESYVDHSNFLYGRSNYVGLFLLDRTDYKGWARGLQKSGYATDPNYANKLISIIEKSDLSKYDSM